MRGEVEALAIEARRGDDVAIDVEVLGPVANSSAGGEVEGDDGAGVAGEEDALLVTDALDTRGGVNGAEGAGGRAGREDAGVPGLVGLGGRRIGPDDARRRGAIVQVQGTDGAAVVANDELSAC